MLTFDHTLNEKKPCVILNFTVKSPIDRRHRVPSPGNLVGIKVCYVFYLISFQHRSLFWVVQKHFKISTKAVRR